MSGKKFVAFVFDNLQGEKMKNKKNLIINLILLSIIIILAVAILILALRPVEQTDNRTDMQKYYDSKCQSYSVQNVNLARGQIVFIGDSITDLYILDDHFADLPLACYNRGIGGDTTSGVLRRLKVSLYDLAPSAVVLMIGTNDINGGLEEDEILERYEQIIDEINTNLPDAQLYCMSIIPQNSQIEEYSHIKIADTTPKILRINARICQLAEEKGDTYLDLFSRIADENNHLIRQYSDDGLHLNSTGLSVWTELIKPYLNGEK
ncbi:MAG: hypothetical protein IJA45_08275 [Oscillospiraceae bacterium]|nr:hypothetical protein [Oscillospiraceae bacterium]